MRDRSSKTGSDALGPDAKGPDATGLDATGLDATSPDAQPAGAPEHTSERTPDPAHLTHPESPEARIDGGAVERGEEPVQVEAGRPVDDPSHPAEAPRDPALEPGTPVYHDEHEEEEAGGRSFATYALLALLLLIAGALLALWAAPRIAPGLPSGMAPVAEWLTPRSTAAEERVVALEAEIAALRQEMAQEPETGAVEARLAELEASLDQRIASVEQSLEQTAGTAGDGGATSEQLAQLQTAVEGQASELASLREQLAAVDAEGVTAQVDVYQAELEGLRGEVRDLARQVGALSGRLDEATASASRQVAEAEARAAEVSEAMGAAEREAAMSIVRSALTSGAPYAEAVNALLEVPGVAIRQELVVPAETGLPTLDDLRDRFSEAAHDAIRAGIVAGAGDSVVARARAFAEAQVASRSLTPQEGDDPDAILSRMEAALRNDDLGRALAEAEALPSESKEAMAPWLADARTRTAAVEAYQELEAELSATN